jgi:redox-sensitive bicupin YhaK (pirin superfamily)
MLARQIEHPVREVIYRTKGHTGGFATRLMSPSDLGELIKPFVFLDRFDVDGDAPMSMENGWHPHSGIATVTVVLEGAVRYAETTGKAGVLSAGSVEWMRAGNGVWHTGAPEPSGVRGFQLWVALPPELENAPNASHYVMPEDVPVEGPVRVILGAYGNAKSPVASPPMSYLVVSLKAGERWSYRPDKGHTVAWVAVQDGALRTPSRIPSGRSRSSSRPRSRSTSSPTATRGSCSARRPSISMTSSSATTPCTPVPRRCAKERRRFAASGGSSVPRASGATR